MERIKSTDFLLYIFCTEILLFSGGIRFIDYPRTCQVIWVATCFLMFLRRPKKVNIVIGSNVYVLFLIIWAFISTVVFNVKADNTYFYYIIYPLGMLLAIPYIRFSKFKNHLLWSLNILMLLSVLVHIGYNLNIVPVQHVEIGSQMRNFSFYIFNVKWDEYESVFFSFTRFSSIYWEPGMCQIVIMFVLVLFTDDIKRNLFNTIYILKKYGILILAILMTCSTMGYLVFALFVSGLIVFSSRKKMLLFPFYALVGAIFVFSIYNSTVVQDKLEQKNETSDRTSYAIRMADNIACLNIAIKNPIFGLGCNSKELMKSLIREGSITSSNGWLYSAAQMGITYLVVLLLALYHNLRKMDLGVPTIFPFTILFISQSNEAATYFPYMWIYACTFLSYKLNSNKHEVIYNHH